MPPGDGSVHIACFVLLQFAILCERVRRPELLGEPVVLYGGSGKEENVQVASDEARAVGIRAGQRLSAARAFCPRLLVLPYDRPLYTEAAAHIWDALAVESSVVEPVSP